ncbi:MAG: hypothetical protein ACTHJ9_06320, partial [Rhodanobacter sp.]
SDLHDSLYRMGYPNGRHAHRGGAMTPPIDPEEAASGYSQRDRELLVRIDTKVDRLMEDRTEDRKKIDEHAQKFVQIDIKFRDVNEKLRKAITPKQLWVGLSSACAVIGTLAGTIFSIINWVGTHR